jgi:hypothetical protein
MQVGESAGGIRNYFQWRKTWDVTFLAAGGLVTVRVEKLV